QTWPPMSPTSRSSWPLPRQSQANTVEALPSLISLPFLSLIFSPAANLPLPSPLKKYSSPGQEPEMMSGMPSPSKSTTCGVKPTHQPEGTEQSPVPAFNHENLTGWKPSPVLSSVYIRSLPPPNWPTRRDILPSPRSPTNGAACPTSTSINLPSA